LELFNFSGLIFREDFCHDFLDADLCCIQALLDGGADPNARNEPGQTPLHYAAGHGNREMVGMLISRGADPGLADCDGVTPADEARKAGYDELAAQMRRIVHAGVRPTHLDTHKHTHLAPPVLDAVARLAQESGVRWVRRPFDFPLHALRRGVPRLKRLTSGALGLLRRRFHRVLASRGCRTTDHFAGFQITGRFRTAELLELLSAIPPGSTELMVHPGHCGPALRAARLNPIAALRFE